MQIHIDEYERVTIAGLEPEEYIDILACVSLVRKHIGKEVARTGPQNGEGLKWQRLKTMELCMEEGLLNAV